MMNRREFSKGIAGLLAAVGVGTKANAEPLTGPITTSDVVLDDEGRPENHRVWTTYYGRNVRVVDMTDSHVRNCALFLYSRLRTFKYELYCLSDVTKRPVLTVSGKKQITQWYDIMCREADRRKLSWCEVSNV